MDAAASRSVEFGPRPKGANNQARGNAPSGPQDEPDLKGRHNAGAGHTIIAPNSGRKPRGRSRPGALPQAVLPAPFRRAEIARSRADRSYDGVITLVPGGRIILLLVAPPGPCLKGGEVMEPGATPRGKMAEQNQALKGRHNRQIGPPLSRPVRARAFRSVRSLGRCPRLYYEAPFRRGGLVPGIMVSCLRSKLLAASRARQQIAALRRDGGSR